MPRPKAPKPNPIDARRTKPRIYPTFTPEGRDMADALAQARGLTLSSLLEQLVRAETEREARKKERKGA